MKKLSVRSVVRIVLHVLQFWRSMVAVLAPLILLAVPFSVSHDHPDRRAFWCGYTVLLCAVYWVCECLPLAITSLLPVVVLPLAGVLSTNAVSINYLKGTNMMFLAGLIMAIAVEHCGLHKRLALNIIGVVGTSRPRLMLGFMLCSMFLSMWISNTAATAMMVPIVDAIHAAVTIQSKEEQEEEEQKSKQSNKTNYGDASRNILLLSCAYASNIGGTGVITGSPPNLVILDQLNKNKKADTEHPMSYATWMAFNVPLMLINTVIVWSVLVLQEKYMSRGRRKTTPEEQEEIKKILSRKKKELGPINAHQLQVLGLFIILVLLWFFRKPFFIYGWAQVKPLDEVVIASATPAVFVVWLLFLLPKEPSFKKPSAALLDWKTVNNRLPWGVILLLGGGFALADATAKSGLSGYLSDQLAGLQGIGEWQLNLLMAFVVTFCTEIMSNTACANIIVPILMQISVGMCVNPIYIMLTASICCSYAFMLPIATAPNAIVFSHSTLRTSDMMKAGFVMNILCIITTNIAVNTWGSPIFGLSTYPEWAQTPANTSLCPDNFTSSFITPDITAITDLPPPALVT